MDPLSAVGLAGTVVQFLDFGIKLVAKANEIHSSAAGAEIRNLELETIAQNFVALNERVVRRCRTVCAYAVSEDEKALEALTVQCVRLGKELTVALNKAKVTGSHKAWKSVRQALKSVLGRDKVQEIYDRLTKYREQLVVVLLVITSAKQSALDEHVETVNQNVLDSETRILDDARKGRIQILQAIRDSHYSPNSPQDVSAVLGLFSDIASKSASKKSQEDFLNSLYYPRMQDRREWISQAHAKTFSWALEGKQDGSTPWHDLRHWLCEEDGIYWLSGKAGSGKSTLMKYIEYDERTVKYLKQWAGQKPLVCASFYFWNPGGSMQKSQLGLLQCLLYEILKQRPSLIPHTFPSRWRSASILGNVAFSWTASELTNSLKLLADTALDTKFCFIIDGLDEFDGDHRNLLDLLFDVTRSSTIKILASSRPWLVFQDSFHASPKMVLQDLTHNDIKAFTKESLHSHPQYARLLSLEPDRAPTLVTEIVDKASGVFLWVYLVVRSLMDGLTNADRISDLQRRLRQLPTDLEQFFVHILSSLDSFYLQQASQLFRLALEARQPLSVLTFSYLDEDDPDFAVNREIKPLSEDEEEMRCKTIERRLNSRCKGLLESRYRQTCDEYSTWDGLVGERISYEVDFLHRTVRDFLKTPTVSVKLVASDTADFNAYMTLTKAYVAQVKGLRRAAHVESNFQTLWSLVFDALHYARLVGDQVPPESLVRLLDELDRAAAVFREDAIVKRRCDPSAHWTNTGYRFGLEPAWDNNFLTLCIQQNLIVYVRQKLRLGHSVDRAGKRPLLAFALTNLNADLSDLDYYEKENISYNAPQMQMVDLLLEYGADPNASDDGETIWYRWLRSMYTFAASDNKPFREQKAQWFQVTRSLILHGASPQTYCQISIAAGKFSDRINLNKGQRRIAGAYYALEIIRLVFGGDSAYDIPELEDAMERSKKEQHTLPLHSRDNSSSYLQVPSKAGAEENGTRMRSTSGSSLHSQASDASWRRPTEEDVVVPIQADPLPPTKQKQESNPTEPRSDSVRESRKTQHNVPARPPLDSSGKKDGRFHGWFRKKRDKSVSTVAYAGT